MKVCFDASVLIPALVDQLANHPAAFAAFRTYSHAPHRAFCSAHCIAEVFAVITALPLRRRVSPLEAEKLIAQSLLSRIDVVELGIADYRAALTAVTARGLSSGIIYDALHVQAALRTGCRRLFTYNINHFRALCGEDIEPATP